MKSTGDMVVGHPQDLPKGSSSGEVIKVTATHLHAERSRGKANAAGQQHGLLGARPSVIFRGALVF